MFLKILGGITLFFLVVALAIGLVAMAGLTAVGVAVGSVVDNLDGSTVEVTDVNGHTETFNFNDLVSEAGRVEITGDNGEQVTIDMNLPQITVQDNGEEVSRVIIGNDEVSSVVIGSDPGIEFSDGSHVRINGRNYDNFDGGFIGRLIGGFFKGMFTLAFWGLVIFGVVMVLRSRKPETIEKTPEDAVV